MLVPDSRSDLQGLLGDESIMVKQGSLLAECWGHTSHEW